MDKARRLSALLKNISIILGITIPLFAFIFRAGVETNNIKANKDDIVKVFNEQIKIKDDVSTIKEIVLKKTNIDSACITRLNNVEKRTLWQSKELINQDKKIEALKTGIEQNKQTYGEIKQFMKEIKSETYQTRISVTKQGENIKQNRQDMLYIRERLDKLGG